MKYKCITLDEAPIDIIDGDRGKNYPNGKDFTSEGFCLFLNAKNVTNKGFVFEEKMFISEEKDNILNKGKLQRKDVVLTTRGTVGNVAYYGNDILYNHIRINSGMVILRANSQEIDSSYIYWYMNSKSVQDEISMVRSGSAQPQLPISTMKSLKIVLPPISIQNKIVAILNSIQVKIELNSKLNYKLIELMKLYFNKNIINVEQDNWEKRSLDDIAGYLNGLAMQKYRPETDKYLPVIKIREMRGGFSENTEKASCDIPRQYIVNDGDVLFSWSGTLEVAIWCNGRGGLNQHIFKVTSEKYPKWFYYLWTCYHLEHFKMIAATKATTMGHIKREELKKAIVYIPDTELMKNLNSLMTPLIDEYIEKAVENRKLAELRDTLLPKLISGEINLDDFDLEV